MSSILDHCVGAEPRSISSGSTLVEEGMTSGRLFVLIGGQVEVVRGRERVAIVGEPGAVFGEMSILLGRPHTATVRAITPVRAYVLEDAAEFLRSHPEIGFHLAKLLAQRLNAATTYLVDIKRQFEGERDHFGMVGEVLESLMHQPEGDFTPTPESRADPRL